MFGLNCKQDAKFMDYNIYFYKGIKKEVFCNSDWYCILV